MALTIPNVASAYYPGQAVPDSTDIAALATAAAGVGVYSGCSVAPWTFSPLQVSVTAGSLYSTANTVGVLAVTAAVLTATTADATFDRRDIVVVSSSAALSIVAGTPSATPVKPAIPAGSIMLAELYIPHGYAVAFSANEITDKRCIIPQPPSYISKAANYTALAGDLIQADSSGGAFTITLPNGPPGNSLVTVMKPDSSSYPVFIIPNSSGGFPTIDGDSSGITLIGQNAGVTLFHRGANIWLRTSAK